MQKKRNRTVKIGIIGVGKMGENHLRNLDMLKQVEITFIYDVNKEKATLLSEQYGTKTSIDLDEDLPKVDGVIIVSPTSTHYDYIEKVSHYVKNIFVEKPLTDSVETTKKVQQLVEQKKLNIQVGFIERYNPAVIALQKIIKNNNNVINIDFARTNKVSSRITDVDVVMDLMIHDIDLAILLNGKPLKINAHGYVNKGMIEYARAIITHNNGAFSNLVASRITEKRIRHISATCEHMYIDCNLLSKEVIVNKQTIEQYLDDVSITSKEETIDVRPQEALLLELFDFVSLCRDKAPVIPNEKNALMAMEAADQIQQIIKDDQ
jgi:predicted dehydrogenase